YGSGAIGGSIHLNTGLDFRSQFKNRLRLDYGSFNTAGANYRLEAGTEKFAVQAAISRNSSDNDYKYLGTVLKNENGQYYNTSINIAAGYKFGTGTILKLYSQLFEGERHLSGTLASPSKSKYQDKNARNMLELASLHGRFMSKLKLAFLSENYSYFEDAEAPFYSYGKAETKIAKYDLVFNINENIQLNSILEYDHIKGSGSDILKSRREVGSGVLLFKHAVSKAFLYEISIRKELADNYKSPVLYSFGTNWRLSGWHALKFNVSKNFRIPTLNDLYWQGNGNASLNPENSWQAEMTQEFSAGNFKFSAAGYYIKIKDLIRWSPESGAVWSPDNVAEVASYGFEGCLNWNKAFRKSKIDFNASYAYTVSNDERLGKQLIYVPYHKMASSVSYSWQKFTAYGSYLFNGKVFTSSDNYYALDRYTVANIGISYALPVASLGFEILNAFDESYQSTLNRPMPGRNFNLNLTFNF
ncbi:MAG TPA: TonB-dependent receptor, partial [Flavobacterium sp.]|nr:TonB-dependent receptor [Flavobacterium sp.]